MAIDPSIALSGIKYQAPDLLNDQYKAISLASMLDQRRRANEEADRKMWLERAAVSDKRRSDYARQIAGTKATKDGKLNKTTYISELLRQGMLTEAKDAMSTFSEAEKRDEEAKKINMETRKQALSTGFSLVQGVYELGQQYGYDHPVTINANQHAVQQYNNIAQRIGMDPVPIPEGPVDPAALQGAMEGFKSAEQRMKEFEALPPEVRAGMTYDRTAPKQGQGEVETVMKAGNAADIDSISPEAAPAGVEIQTFNPEQIRPLEEGGNIPGEAPKLLASADYQTTQTNVPAPPKESMGRLAMVNAAKGKPELYMWDENGNLVRNDSMYQDKLKLAKAGASKSQVNVGLQNYEKKLDQNRADKQSKYETQAVTMQESSAKVRSIVDALQGFKGQRWDQLGALIGEYLPGTDLSKITSARDLANSIRSELAPKFRVEGSGATSDFEMQMWLNAIPSLVNSPEARAEMLAMAEKFADRAEKISDIHDAMIREGNFTSSGFRKRVQDELGEGALTPLERQRLKAFQKGDATGMPAASQPPGNAGATIRRYNPETGRIE